MAKVLVAPWFSGSLEKIAFNVFAVAALIRSDFEMAEIPANRATSAARLSWSFLKVPIAL